MAEKIWIYSHDEAIIETHKTELIIGAYKTKESAMKAFEKECLDQTYFKNEELKQNAKQYMEKHGYWRDEKIYSTILYD